MQQLPENWQSLTVTTNSNDVPAGEAGTLIVEWIGCFRDNDKKIIGVHHSADGWNFGDVKAIEFPRDAEYLDAEKFVLVPPGRIVEVV